VARLRARAAQQEAKLIAEKSMIGRLHNKLAELNFERLRWEEGLEARDGALAAARAQARATRPPGSTGFSGRESKRGGGKPSRGQLCMERSSASVGCWGYWQTCSARRSGAVRTDPIK